MLRFKRKRNKLHLMEERCRPMGKKESDGSIFGIDLLGQGDWVTYQLFSGVLRSKRNLLLHLFPRSFTCFQLFADQLLCAGLRSRHSGYNG